MQSCISSVLPQLMLPNYLMDQVLAGCSHLSQDLVLPTICPGCVIEMSLLVVARGCALRFKMRNSGAGC